MAFMGRLAGGVESRLTNIVLAYPLNFTQNGDASDALAFVQTAEVEVIRPALSPAAEDTLVFVQEATAFTVREFYANASDVLAFEQAATGGGPVYVSVSQTINFVQDEEGRRGNPNVFVADVLNFRQRAGRTIEITVEQDLGLTQDGERRNIVEHELNLLQSVIVGKGPFASNVLAFEQVASRLATFNRTVAQSLGLVQATTYFVIRPCTYKQYTPFIGTNGDASFPPPSAIVPTLSADTVTLSYPYSAPTETLVLRNPAWGDRDRLSFNRINRLTRGGSLIVFADPKWPKTQTLVLQIDALKQSQVIALLSFLELSLGQEIGLLDWEGRQWRGIIVNPDSPITHVSRQDRSVSLEFQGVPD